MKRRLKHSKERNSDREESTSEYDEQESSFIPDSGLSVNAGEEHETMLKRPEHRSRAAKQKDNTLFPYIVISLLSILVVVLLTAIIFLSTQSQSQPKCQFQESDYVTPRNLQDPEPFDDLTLVEYKNIMDFLLGSKELKLTPFDKAWPNNSYVLSVDLFLPNKADVIEYSDNGGQKPIRQAIVMVIRGDQNPPRVEEYIVSPLPNPTSADLYKNPSFRMQTIPYTSKPMDNVDCAVLYDIIIKNAMEKMYPLLIESFGRGFHNCTGQEHCLFVIDIGPKGYKPGDRKSWVWTFVRYGGYYIHPVGLEILVEHKSTDITKWLIEMVVYNGQKFESVESLMNAYKTKTLKLAQWKDVDLDYATYGMKGTSTAPPIQGPRLFEPDGKRYRVDGQHVTYGKWSFHYHMMSHTGLQIFDVKFDGTRLAYELSLQEVLVLYTGYGPTNSYTKYYDRSWFMGALNFELARGVDCPETAVFLDTYFLTDSGAPRIFKNNVCIFENNGAIPLRRHYANDFKVGYDFYGGLVDHHIIIRTMSTILNYEYIFDYIFYSNGAIEVKATATGFLQATYRLPEDEKYGSVIHQNVVANLHEHLFNFKVDLDIDGVKNRYMTLDVGMETINDPWVENATRTQMKITPVLIEKESLNPTDKGDVPQYHIFLHNNHTNKYKSNKAYRILNKDPASFLLKDEPFARAAKWAKYPIIVTRRKDEEQSSSAMYSQHHPWDPVLDFATFVNDESLVDEDLVAWVTMGVYHIPGTEDVPSTPTVWNQYSFFLTPHNYFTECPGVNSIDNVLIRPTKDDRSKPIIKTYGRSYESTCIPDTLGPDQYDGIRRDV